MDPEASNPALTPPCWTNLLKQNPPQSTHKPPNPTQIFSISGNSTKGIAVIVLDASAIIQGGEKLHQMADKFVSVPEVINEVRDPTSRHRLSILPFAVDTMEPSPDALKRVISFARETGDLQNLSDVDIKLIALAYTLEAQIHGTKHLRDKPPPVHMLRVRRLPEPKMPGWGSNVPNLEEWEALEGAVENNTDANSRILPLKNLNLNVPVEDNISSQGGSVGFGSKNDIVVDDHASESSRGPMKYLPEKREVKTEGKKMVASGIDASQGQYGDDAGDFLPAVSRSTHRRYLMRKARRELHEASLKGDEQQDADDENAKENLVMDGVAEETENTERSGDADVISTILKQMGLEEDLSAAHGGKDEATASCEELDASVVMDGTSSEENLLNYRGNEQVDKAEFDHVETESQASEMADSTYVDDDGDSSEQSWMLRSLSVSSVACITGDFAMQNVILQMGLRLLAPGGMQIRELHRWILKCHACLNVTSEIGRIFCPKCGNGGTLRKVAVTIGENGLVLAARRPRISLRGTRFSLPLPQSGRDAITKNPILREDQLPQKLLYPKTKKKANKQEDDFLGSASIFTHHTDKKAPHRPPVRQALAMFSGKRNPNDNHYSRLTTHKR
ncbi:hypothetical protein Dimus_007618 [Dionaea muscipula]